MINYHEGMAKELFTKQTQKTIGSMLTESELQNISRSIIAAIDGDEHVDPEAAYRLLQHAVWLTDYCNVLIAHNKESGKDMSEFYPPPVVILIMAIIAWVLVNIVPF